MPLRLKACVSTHLNLGGTVTCFDTMRWRSWSACFGTRPPPCAFCLCFHLLGISRQQIAKRAGLASWKTAVHAEGNHGTSADRPLLDVWVRPPQPLQPQSSCQMTVAPRVSRGRPAAQLPSPPPHRTGRNDHLTCCFKLLSFGIVCYVAARVEIIVNRVKMKVLY